MKEVALTVSQREGTGKGAARRTRSSGFIPAVLYGPQTKPESIKVDQRDFNAAWKKAGGGSVIFNLDNNGKKKKVLIRELQRDPVTSEVIHVDFHAISMVKPIHLSIPIHLVGTPVGVKTDGGIMQTTMRELEISCLPTDIPEHLEINVEELHIGDSVHVRDLSLENAKILDDSQRTVVVISAPTVMKTVEEEAAEAAAEGEVAEGEAAAEGEVAEGEAAAKGDAPAEADKKEEQDPKKQDKPKKG